MYRAAVDFREALKKINDPELKSHVFKYKKYMKQSTLNFRKLRFDVEEKVQRENMEREARQQVAAAYPSISQSKYKGKDVIETLRRAHSSQEMEALQRGEEFKQGLAKLTTQLRTQVQEDEPQPKKQKTQPVSQQPQVPEALVAQIEHIPQQVLMDEQPLQIVTLSLQEKVPLQIPLIQQVKPQP